MSSDKSHSFAFPAVHPTPTLAECFGGRDDNFLILRLLAAAAVILGHSYALAAIPGMHDFVANLGWAKGVYTGSLAVDVFFVISGFLVTGSYLRGRNVIRFAQSRLLRVIPGYLVCVSLTALVLGAAMTTLSLMDYWSNPATWDYIWGNMHFKATELRWHLPGVFEDHPLPGIVNGSLWTLPSEMQMYLWLGVLGVVGILRFRTLASALLIGFVVWEFLYPGWSSLFLFQDPDYLRLAGFFIAGSICFLNAHLIRLDGRIVLLLVASCFMLHASDKFGYLMAVTLAYTTLWFAYIPKIPAGWLKGDYSYGMYLWGYPSQQLVVAFLDDPQPMPIFWLSLPLATVFAVASWHWVESPALKLKRWRLFRASAADKGSAP